MVGVLGAIVLVAAGCAGSFTDPGPGRRVEASVVRSAYLSGESINITVKNLSDVRLAYPSGFCKIELQRLENTEWETVLVPDGCVLVLAFLGPRQSVTQEYRLSSAVTPGIYRLSMPMPIPEGATAEPRLLTPPFSLGFTTSSQ
jgi:hypothetical protein